MPPVQHVNIYILTTFGMLAATMFGMFYFYSGMNEVSFVVSNGLKSTTYFLDKHSYDRYLNGLIYSTTFFVATFLCLIVIAVPTQQQVQQRAAMAAAFGAPGMSVQPAVGMGQQPPPSMMPQGMPAQPTAPPQAMAPPQAAAPQPAPTRKAKSKAEAPPPIEEEEYLEEDEFGDTEQTEQSGDEDVVYGTGRVSDEATVDFIHKHSDSAVKFLFRKNLDGKPLSPAEDEIYRGWQKRGLSRAKIREYILQIMEWENIPSIPVHDVWSKLRDQIFELTH